MAKVRIELERSSDDDLWDYELFVNGNVVSFGYAYTTDENALEDARDDLTDWMDQNVHNR